MMAMPSDTLRILITGAGGQVGTELRKAAPPRVTLLALNRASLDVTDRAAVDAAVSGFRPHWIVNAAAYTGVDRAETERDAAFAINRDGAANLAKAAADAGAKMLHVSTDYVFDGRQSRPYRVNDPPAPINVYGESKLAGELVVRDTLGDRACILRTSWLYAAQGRNFLLTMLKLMPERSELRVVEDQIGTPTSAAGLASAIYAAMDASLSGTYHWTDAGVGSWYDFAAAIQALAGARSESVRRCRILPISGDEYPAAARRPAYSVLDKSAIRGALDIPPMDWRKALEDMIQQGLGL